MKKLTAFTMAAVCANAASDLSSPIIGDEPT